MLVHLPMGSQLFSRIAGCVLSLLLADEPSKPLTAKEARAKVNEEVVVEFHVKAAKNRLEKRGEIYLDSETDFRDENNLACVINRDGALSLQNAKIPDPAEHFLDKRVRVRGKVTTKEDLPRIEISDAKQIELVEQK